MPLDLPGAASRLRRTLPLAAASALALALPAGAQASVDNLAAGGVLAHGSALTVGVSGTSAKAGAIEARFSAATSPLFWGSDTSTMNDGTAALFSLNTPSGLYSAQSELPVDNVPFTQLQAPVLTGTGTAGDPFVITSRFRATSKIDITQTVTHVSGTTRFTAAWAIHNSDTGGVNLQAFEGADMYVADNDYGTGVMSGSAPNRTIGSVAPDGTVGYLVEQAGSALPWSHYFSGSNMPFYQSSGDSTYGYLPDTIDPTSRDSGAGVEWDITLPANTTRTYSVQWYFTAPAAPQAPQVTGTPSGTVRTTTAAPAFAPAAGDTQVVSYECSLDAAAYAPCTSPASLSGLADGEHSYAVRATNSAGIPGPATTKTWTVDTTPPVAPSVDGAPSGTVATDTATLTLGGEDGATFKCSIDGGAYVTCTSPLVLSGLADGNHTVAVKQADAAGNAGTLVTTKAWTVDTSVPAAPATDSEPVDTTATAARLTFTTPAGLSAECALDGAAYQACASPVDVAGLGVGTHTLALRMVNAAGTAGAARTVTWEVRAPVVPVVPVTPVTPAPVTDTVTSTRTETPATKAETPSAAPAPAPATTLAPQQCVSRRAVTVHWALPKGATAKGYKIVVDGQVVRTVSAKTRAYRLSLAGRPAASIRVQVKAIGAKLATTRVYRTCVAKAGAGSLPTVLLKKTA